MNINRYKGFNILIFMFSIFFIIFGLIATFSYKQPSNIKEVTGNISNFKQRDGKWYDSIFGGGKNEFFNIGLNDDLYFEATGIAYDNIDKKLFGDLTIGDEITIIYNDEGFMGPNKIYNINYNDRNYLNIDDVLQELEYNESLMKTTGPTIILTTIIVGFFLFFWNYNKNKIRKEA